MLPYRGTGEDHAAQGVGDVDTKGVRCEAEGREGGFVQMAGSPCMPTTLDGRCDTKGTEVRREKHN